eukprot:281465-Pleurochrysis_carterae.AAC.1
MGATQAVGLAHLRGGFDAGVRRGDVGDARTGARKPGAEREPERSVIMPSPLTGAPASARADGHPSLSRLG